LRALLPLLLCFAVPAWADSSLPAAPLADVQLADPAKETRAKALMESIRCLVCEGQSVADSNAEMAGDMRSLIRTRIEAGESPEAIRDWLIARYGTGITYNPPLGPETIMLWLAPVLMLGLGFVLVRGRVKRRA
jgi:cytochrome c-type biogenesis protein CcmH